MTAASWKWVEAGALLLEPEERELVLGDLIEAGDSAFAAFAEVAGLALRRQVEFWADWRPWVAAFGLAFPASFALMGLSIGIGWAVVSGMDGHWFRFCCQLFLLVSGGWIAGLVAGSLSRRTLWVSAVLTLAPCLFCLSRFRIDSLSRLCLLLFLPAAIRGARMGLRRLRIGRSAALIVAVTVTLSMVASGLSGKLWFLDLALLWPAWYLVATAQMARAVKAKNN
jgi:hypothetical protein